MMSFVRLRTSWRLSSLLILQVEESSMGIGILKRECAVQPAVEKDGDKERTKLLSSLHVSSLLKTFLPLAIILQKTMCNTCSFECGMQNDIGLTAWLPFSGLFLPNKVMREVEIGILLCCRDCAICSKPLSKDSHLGGITVHNLLWIIIIIEIDRLLIWKVNRQTIDRGLLFMHGKFCNVPKSL